MAISQLINNYIPRLRLHCDGINSTDFSMCDLSNNKLYSLPQVKPSEPSVIEIDTSGNGLFIPISSLPSNPFSLVNELPNVSVVPNSMCIFTGDTNNFNCVSTNALTVDNINNNINVENSLNCNGGVSCVGINSYQDIRIFNTPSNPNFSFLAMNEDDGLDIVDTNGEITLANSTTSITVSQMVRWFNNIGQVLQNLTDINVLD